jgi:subtilisin
LTASSARPILTAFHHSHVNALEDGMLASRHRAVTVALFILAAHAFIPESSLVRSPSLLAQPAQGRVRVLVGFKDAVSNADEAVVRAAGGQVRRRFQIVPAVAAEIPAQALEALRAHARITVVEPDVSISAVDAELDNSWGVKRIGAGTVHDGGVRGAGVKIAVLDTGIDYTHPDLAASYGGGSDFVNNDADPFDDNFHGTHVAGTIAARDDDAGVVGVAPDATIYALKVLDHNGNGSFSGVIAALDWVVAHGVQITSNSYGSATDPGTIVRAAFENASLRGILHVAAAGNSGNCLGTGDTVIYPAKYPSVIAVAGIDQADQAACFSSAGAKVELAAPGVGVTSTMPGGGYDTFNGTSMATPHVSGTAALVLSRGVIDTNGNGRVNDELRNILDLTAQDLGTAGRDTRYGFGLVDAVAAVAGPPPPEPAVSVTVTTNKASYLKGVDTTAQLTAIVRNEFGAAIAGLGSGSFVTLLDAVGAAVSFAETVPGTYVGTLDIGSAATGSHTALVTTTDTRGLVRSASASFTVAVPVSNTVRVQSIDYSTYGGLNGKRNLVISVLVVNGSGAPVANAIVSVIAYRNGGFYGAANGISGANGRAVFEASGAPAGCYQTLVAAVLAGTRSWDGVTPANGFCK